MFFRRGGGAGSSGNVTFSRGTIGVILAVDEPLEEDFPADDVELVMCPVDEDEELLHPFEPFFFGEKERKTRLKPDGAVCMAQIR